MQAGRYGVAMRRLWHEGEESKKRKCSAGLCASTCVWYAYACVDVYARVYGSLGWSGLASEQQEYWSAWEKLLVGSGTDTQTLPDGNGMVARA